MSDVAFASLAGGLLGILLTIAGAYIAGRSSVRAWADERISRLEEALDTLRKVLADEKRQAEVAARSRATMAADDRARAEALAAATAHERLDRVLSLFPDSDRPSETVRPTDASSNDAQRGGSAGEV